MPTFLKDEAGAVTVDWVVLTAALVGLGLATAAVVSTGAQDLSEDVEDQLMTDMITTSFGPTPLTAALREIGAIGAGAATCTWNDVGDTCADANWSSTTGYQMDDGSWYTIRGVWNEDQSFYNNSNADKLVLVNSDNEAVAIVDSVEEMNAYVPGFDTMPVG